MNSDGALVVRSTRSAEDSTPARIARPTEAAQNRRPAVSRLLDAFGDKYSRAILAFTALVMVVGPLALGWPLTGRGGAMYRAFAFLSAAAPCALLMSPLVYVAAVGACARRGCWSGGVTFDALAECGVVALDKTGTITSGRMRCASVEAPLFGDARRAKNGAAVSAAKKNGAAKLARRKKRNAKKVLALGIGAEETEEGGADDASLDPLEAAMASYAKKNYDKEVKAETTDDGDAAEAGADASSSAAASSKPEIIPGTRLRRPPRRPPTRRRWPSRRRSSAARRTPSPKLDAASANPTAPAAAVADFRVAHGKGVEVPRAPRRRGRECRPARLARFGAAEWACASRGASEGATRCSRGARRRGEGEVTAVRRRTHTYGWSFAHSSSSSSGKNKKKNGCRVALENGETGVLRRRRSVRPGGFFGVVFFGFVFFGFVLGARSSMWSSENLCRVFRFQDTLHETAAEAVATLRSGSWRGGVGMDVLIHGG